MSVCYIFIQRWRILWMKFHFARWGFFMEEYQRILYPTPWLHSSSSRKQVAVWESPAHTSILGASTGTGLGNRDSRASPVVFWAINGFKCNITCDVLSCIHRTGSTMETPPTSGHALYLCSISPTSVKQRHWSGAWTRTICLRFHRKTRQRLG